MKLKQGLLQVIGEDEAFVYGFFFSNCDIQIPGGGEQTFLIWVQWSSVTL